MRSWTSPAFSRKSSKPAAAVKRQRRGKPLDLRRRLVVDQLEDRAAPAGLNPSEIINTALTATDLATMLVGSGVAVSNATFTGSAASTGSFTFTNPTVVGFGQGLLLTSGRRGGRRRAECVGFDLD